MKRFLQLFFLAVSATFCLGAETVDVAMTRTNTFDPRDITITVGDTVTWSNPYPNTFHDAVDFNGSFATALLGFGESASVTFDTVGRFDYFCTPHLELGMIGSITVIPAGNNRPEVAIISPEPDANFLSSVVIQVVVEATDDGPLARVDLYVDGFVVQSKTAEPYEFDIQLAGGTRALMARATDEQGLARSSEPIFLNVEAVNLPPNVAITSPLDQAEFTAPATITIDATASDDSIVTSVDFLVDGTMEASDDTVPYTFARTFQVGTYRLTAVAHDETGLSATSGEVIIIVKEREASAPEIQITFPLEGQYVDYVTNSPIRLVARAGDEDGAINFVEFYEGADLLGRVNPPTSPVALPKKTKRPTNLPPNSLDYALDWPGSEGRHSIRAKAIDDQGNFTLSDPVSFTVALPILFTTNLVVGTTNRLGVYGTSGVSFVFDYAESAGGPWTPFYTNILYRRILFFDDTTANGRTNRIYRARSPDAPL